MSNNKQLLSTALCFLLCVSFRTIWQSLVLFPSSSKVSANEPQETIPSSIVVSRDNNGYYPRIVSLLDMDHQVSSRYYSTKNAIATSKQQRRRLRYPMHVHPKNSSSLVTTSKILREFEASWFEECEPTVEIPIRPTCNTLHELDSFESPEVSLLSMQGSWRSVWKVPAEASSSSNLFVVLKLLHMHRDFEEEAFTSHQLDNMVMERLSSSPHVVSSFGFCGQSVVTDMAENAGRSLLKDPSLTWKQRLLMARDLARGLAELHALRRLDFELHDHEKEHKSIIRLDNNNHTTNSLLVFAHHDINTANLVSLSRLTLQWNDFNLGIVSRRRRSSGSGSSRRETAALNAYCPIPIRYQGLLWRSPEEIQNTTGHLPQLQPSDVYSLGSILFVCMSKHQPWTHLEDPKVPLEQVAQIKVQGITLPHLPIKYQPKRWEQHVLWLAIQACFRRDPKQRPTAYHLALALGTAYDWITILQTKAKASNNTMIPSQQAIKELFLVPKQG